MVDYPAHMIKINDVKHVQTVSEHCRNTALYAAYKIESIGLYNIGYISGLLHDMGKEKEEYKNYIEKIYNGENPKRGTVNHTFCGVIYIMEHFHKADNDIMENLTAEIISYAIGAHHGLFDCVSLNGESGFEHRIFKDKNEIYYKEASYKFLDTCSNEKEITDIFHKAVVEVSEFIKNASSQFHVGLLCRIVLSAVIDGDRRDTAEFMNNTKLNYTYASEKFWSDIFKNVQKKKSSFKNDSKINMARKNFSDKCIKFAKNPPGIYKLTIPTGSGKTISSLEYALKHAEIYGKNRIIFVIPLLSILEQNSKVIKKYCDSDEYILEHHSNVIRPVEHYDELDEYEILCETWESPIIVTTMVQLLNTFFDGRTTSVRRFASLKDSVIVIDEIQSIPKKTINMFNATLNFLVSCLNVTVILSSATQPCLDITKNPLIYGSPQNVIEYDKSIFDEFNRTRIIDKTTKYGMTIDELSDFSLDIFEDVFSLLIICNTKLSAKNLFYEIKHMIDFDCEIYFLSTDLCMKHRKDVLEKINQALGNKSKKVICVSTQLVEAGVDFSFNSVIRVQAGLDNIAQAAGRCNRNGEYNSICNVFIVNLQQKYEDLRYLKEIQCSQNSARSIMYENKDCDMLQNDIITKFYKNLYNDAKIKEILSYPYLENDVKYELYSLLSTNRKNLARAKISDRYALNQSFKTAGTAFKVFDEETFDIIVPYNDEAKEIIADLLSQKAKFEFSYTKALLEKAKQYTINVFWYKLQQLQEKGVEYSDDEKRVIILNEMFYDEKDAGLKTDDLII